MNNQHSCLMILPFLYAEGILQQLITTSEHHIIPPQQWNAWRVTKPQPYKALGLVISLSTEKKTQVYEITREKSPQQVKVRQVQRQTHVWDYQRNLHTREISTTTPLKEKHVQKQLANILGCAIVKILCQQLNRAQEPQTQKRNTHTHETHTSEPLTFTCRVCCLHRQSGRCCCKPSPPTPADWGWWAWWSKNAPHGLPIPEMAGRSTSMVHPHSVLQPSQPLNLEPPCSSCSSANGFLLWPAQRCILSQPGTNSLPPLHTTVVKLTSTCGSVGGHR